MTGKKRRRVVAVAVLAAFATAFAAVMQLGAIEISRADAFRPISSAKTSTICLPSFGVVRSTRSHRQERAAFLLLPESRGWHRVTRSSTVALGMGKGDGKKKRKRKSNSLGSPSPAAASAPSPAEPMRVSSNINIPVRDQIKIAQLNKQARQYSGSSFRQRSVVRTKYRRTWDEEEIEQKAEERRRRGQEPDWDVILSRNATSPLVIVDGYNIIHSWARLKKHMVRGDSQRARELLIDDLENLSSLKGWRIECVFDGTRRSTVGPLGQGPAPTASRPTNADRATTKSVSKHGVRVVYTGVGIEADSYIEARCAEAKAVTDGSLSRSFIVATDDAMIRLAGQSAGALCMGADRFCNELKAVKKAVAYRVEAAVAKANGHAIRPEKLRASNTQIHRFGRGSVLIEDKRNRTKATEKKKLEEELLLDVDIDVEDDGDAIPWWAKVPGT